MNRLYLLGQLVCLGMLIGLDIVLYGMFLLLTYYMVMYGPQVAENIPLTLGFGYGGVVVSVVCWDRWWWLRRRMKNYGVTYRKFHQ